MDARIKNYEIQQTQHISAKTLVHRIDRTLRM